MLFRSHNLTKTWHYANIDKGQTYRSMQKNPKGDVVTALDSLTREFRENRSVLSDSLKADYIMMIVHMVGDLHCPMHAGRLSDLGGNRVFTDHTGIEEAGERRPVAGRT